MHNLHYLNKFNFLFKGHWKLSKLNKDYMEFRVLDIVKCVYMINNHFGFHYKRITKMLTVTYIQE